MKRIVTILLALVMVFSCSFTAMAYTAAETKVKIIDSNGTRDITSKLGNRYITDNENLMIPAETTYREMGLTQIEWGIRDNVKVLCAVNPLDNWNTGVNYAEYPTYAANGEIAGTLDPTPVFQDGIAMIAIQNLEKLWKIPVKFDANTKTYYIVMDKSKMGSTVAALPDAETGENLMAVKKSNSDPNTIKVNLVINGKSKDITTTAIPQNSNGKLMINAKPILRSLDAVIIQNKENCLWGGHRSSDSRLFVVYYDTGVMAHGYNNGVTLDGVYATVNPKLIDDSLLLYYKDFEGLTGGVANYDAKTKTCTISITDEWLVNNSVANNTINSEVITNQDTANTNSVQEPATVENYKTAQQKEREREALERQREREREERQREREREERQKRLAELEAELEQLQKEREARERQREQAERAKEEALQKTRMVLKKGQGFVYESEIEDNSDSSYSTSSSNSEQKTRRVLRAGVGWVWE